MTNEITPDEVSVLNDDATALILNIMEQNAKNAAYTTNSLLDNYREAQLRAEATIAAIRWNIRKLFESGYQPTESAVMDAVWPWAEQIDAFMEKNND